MKIDKKNFMNTIGSLKLQMKHDVKCGDAFSIILPDDHVTLYDNSYIINAMIDLLKYLTDDYDEYPWIEYFIYELDFGSKYKDGMIKDSEGDIIKLENSSDLYALLVNNSKK